MSEPGEQELQRLLEDYREAVIAGSEAGSVREQNALAARRYELAERLRASAEGMRALATLLEDEDSFVRVFAAMRVYEAFPEQAHKTLQGEIERDEEAAAEADLFLITRELDRSPEAADRPRAELAAAASPSAQAAPEPLSAQRLKALLRAHLDAETVERLLALYDEQCARSRELAARYELDHVVPHPHHGRVSLR